MRSSLRTMVNCESCEHYLYLYDKDGYCRGNMCENDFATSDEEFLPLSELSCHSLYELYEQEQERYSDALREEGA